MDIEFRRNEIRINVEFSKDLSEVERTYLSGFDGAKVTLDKDIYANVIALSIIKEEKE